MEFRGLDKFLSETYLDMFMLWCFHCDFDLSQICPFKKGGTQSYLFTVVDVLSGTVKRIRSWKMLDAAKLP